MTQDRSVAEQIFAGKSEMATRMRSFDWSQTPLGSAEAFPQSLRSALSICLNSRFPIAIYWGQDCLLFYNDAWRPIVGNKHPWAIGRPAQEVWSEIWDDIGPELAGVLATGEGTFHNDELLSMHRFGYTEECFFEYTFNPIQGEGGAIEGVFNVVSETTYRVLNDRRARLLREVASRTGSAKTVEDMGALMVKALQSDPTDMPFSLLYLLDLDGQHAYLCGNPNFALDRNIYPPVIDLAAEEPDRWAIAQVIRTAQAQVIDDLVSRFGVLPGSPWVEPPQEAMVLPIAAAGQPRKVMGVLVAVASPRRRLDDNYRDFLGQVVGQIAMAIANTRSYEEESKRAEALAQLDRAKTAFFSNVSHEFRTPLTLMLSPLEELSNAIAGQLQPDQQEQLQMIQRNGLRLQKLVNTLLDFSRIEAGRVQASYEPIDLASYTAELSSVFRSLIEQAGMSLEIECATLPKPVYVDREMWEKIVLNLLSNAFKFTFSGTITIQLQAVGDCVELSVADTGVGVPEAEIDRLFERFHRVAETRSRTYEGSGIGLALVQELVKLHGGTIRVTSQVDQGTTFTIALPFGTAHLPGDRIEAPRPLIPLPLGASSYVVEASRWISETATAIESPKPLDSESSLWVPAPFQNSLPKAQVLVVDDNADMREYLKHLLNQHYEVETAVDGIAALTFVRQQMPDLVLSDVMMPNLDGFGLLRELRANPPTREIPLILLSARAGEESRIEGLEAGADDYLIKPFSSRELLARVETTLKLSRIRKEAEQTVRENEERLRFALSAARMVAWDWDLVTGISQRSENAAEILGLGTSHANDFYDRIHPDDRATVDAAVACALQGEAYNLEFRLITPEGYIWIADKASLRYNDAGQPVRLIGVCVDITDSKQAEESLRQREAELREAQRVGNIGSWHWDAKTDVTTGSSQLLRIYGFDPERDTMPNFAAQEGWLYPHESWQRINVSMQQAMETGRGYELDVPAFRNSTPIWVTTRGEVLRDSENKIVGLRGTVQDITARKQVEAQLYESEERLRMLLIREQAARESAEVANRVKDEFLAVLSHELRSPLNPILGWSKLLQQGKLDTARTQSALNTIERNAQLQAQLINDLLDISRILRGKLSLNITPVDLSLVIGAALETVRLAAEAKSLQIQTMIPPMPGTVMGDAGRLQQVLWNLLSNAVKFTPQGGQVTVTLTEIDIHAQIQVTDTGKGIDPEFLPYVFEHFRQEDAATTRKFGGLGLGLAIARQIVELHGGTIAVNSLGVNQGATFTVYLPLAPLTSKVPTSESPLATIYDLSNIHILVVDDEIDSREFIAFVLEQAGATVTPVASGMEALENIEQLTFNLIVSDIGMPEMDGYMLMQQIQLLEPGRQIPAIALTAYAGEFDRQQALQAGFQRHLSKPIDPNELVEAISLLCNEFSAFLNRSFQI